MKQKIGAALAALYMGLVPVSAEAAGRAELMVGQESSTLDVTAVAPVGPLTLVNRGRMTTDYEGGSGFFNLSSLGYGIGNGFSVFVRGDTTSEGITPRAGVNYGNQFGDVSVLAGVGVSPEGNSDILARVEYTSTILDKLRGFLGLETVTNFNKGTHNFSLQRARAGVQKDGLEAGIALDLNQSGGKYVGTNVGGYCRTSF